MIDFHTHWVPSGLPDLAARTGDSRWPVFDRASGQLMIGGVAVRALPPAGWDVSARLDAMDAAGVERHVLSPVPPLLCDWAGRETGLEWATAVNDALAALAADHPDRFSALGAIPVTHPGAAVAALERAKASGLAGVEVTASALDEEFDAPRLRAVFTAAADLGLVVFIHPLHLGAAARWTTRITHYPVNFGLGMTTDTAIAAARLLLGGVLADAPGLRVCLAHGGGTFAWALARMNVAWDEAAQGQTLAEAVRPFYADSVVYQPANLRYVVDTLGPDHVCFGTDYPLPVHSDLAGQVVDSLDPGAGAWVREGTASALLGLQ
jgi:aminocarboxymuconate-semialdehyde decarboxylase